MLLGFGYLYKFDVLFIYFFFKKQKIEKKAGWPKFGNFMFLFKIGSIEPVDQQINLVSPYKKKRD